MAVNVFFGVYLLCVAVLQSGAVIGTEVRIQVFPREIVLGGGDATPRLDITCKWTEVNADVRVNFGKVVNDGRRINLVTFDTATDHGSSIVDPSVQGRSRSSGWARNGSVVLDVSIYRLKCEDSLTYFCGSDNDTSIATTNVTYKVNPRTPYLRVSPRSSEFLVGEQITITCNGRVGMEINQSHWAWEWRVADQQEDWAPYPCKENIKTLEPKPDPVRSCEFETTSSLIHTLTRGDHLRQIRCSITEPKYSDQMTIIVGGKGNHSNDFDLMLVLGLGVFALMVAVAATLLVLLVRYRRSLIGAGDVNGIGAKTQLRTSP